MVKDYICTQNLPGNFIEFIEKNFGLTEDQIAPYFKTIIKSNKINEKKVAVFYKSNNEFVEVKEIDSHGYNHEEARAFLGLPEDVIQYEIVLAADTVVKINTSYYPKFEVTNE